MKKKTVSKVCNKCGINKGSNCFSKHTTSKDGLQYACKECDNRRNRELYINNIEESRKRRKEYYWNNLEKSKENNRNRYLKNPNIGVNSRFKRIYGIDLIKYEILLENQNFSCAICLTNYKNFSTRLCVDHDHSCCPGKKSCGKCIRGLLCGSCNKGIGLLQENYNIIIRAGAYVNEKNI